MRRQSSTTLVHHSDDLVKFMNKRDVCTDKTNVNIKYMKRCMPECAFESSAPELRDLAGTFRPSSLDVHIVGVVGHQIPSARFILVIECRGHCIQDLSDCSFFSG